MAKRSSLTKAGMILAFTAVGSTLLVSPASAHSGSYYKARSGCVYTGGISALHNYAWTRKDTGSCAGDAWLRVQFSNGTFWENHALPGISISTGEGGIIHSWHKSQSGESYVQSH